MPTYLSIRSQPVLRFFDTLLFVYFVSGFAVPQSFNIVGKGITAYAFVKPIFILTRSGPFEFQIGQACLKHVCQCAPSFNQTFQFGMLFANVLCSAGTGLCASRGRRFVVNARCSTAMCSSHAIGYDWQCIILKGATLPTHNKPLPLPRYFEPAGCMIGCIRRAQAQSVACFTLSIAPSGIVTVPIAAF